MSKWFLKNEKLNSKIRLSNNSSFVITRNLKISKYGSFYILPLEILTPTHRTFQSVYERSYFNGAIESGQMVSQAQSGRGMGSTEMIDSHWEKLIRVIRAPKSISLEFCPPVETLFPCFWRIRKGLVCAFPFYFFFFFFFYQNSERERTLQYQSVWTIAFGKIHPIKDPSLRNNVRQTENFETLIVTRETENFSMPRNIWRIKLFFFCYAWLAWRYGNGGTYILASGWAVLKERAGVVRQPRAKLRLPAVAKRRRKKNDEEPNDGANVAWREVVSSMGVA